MPTSALLAALACAVGISLSTAVQHHASAGTPHHVEGYLRLMGHLVRSPLWLLGQVLSLTSFALHGLALQLGALAVVQPVVVGGMVLAVPVRAALGRQRPSAVELRAVALTGIGLAVLVRLTRPDVRIPGPADVPAALVLTAVGLTLVLLTHVCAGRTHHLTRRSALLGATAGVLFGLMAGLLKLEVSLARDIGPLASLGDWPVWALVLTGVAGTAVNQEAYRGAALSASMPVLNIVDVVVALAFGLAAFGEVPAHSAGVVLLDCLALGCVAVGLRRLTAREVA